MELSSLGSPTPEPTRPRTSCRRAPYRRTVVAVGALGLLAAGVGTAGSAQASASMYVAPYVDMSNSQESVLNTVISSDGLSAYTAAFVIGAGCTQEWGDTLPVGNDPITGGEISTAKSEGAQVIVSSGGAGGEPLSFTCTNQSTIDAGYQAIINDYGTDYLDFDIEGAAVADTASIDRTLQAMKDLKASNPGLVWSLTIPVTPTGLDDYGTAIVQDAKNLGVSIPVLNIMAMDYYQGGIEMGQAAISAAEATLGQMRAVDSSYTYGNIGLTPMIGTNDDGSTFTTADATTVADWAGQNGLGRLSFWSVDRDQSCSAAAVTAAGASPQAVIRPNASPTCSGVSQSTGQYTKLFLSGGGTGGTGGGGTGGGGTGGGGTGGGGGGTGGSGSCYAAWNASTAYVPGDEVSYNGENYTSTYWSTGVTPGSAIAWDIWQADGSC
jgi:chitinase